MKFNIFFKEESGQGMAEYALILALIALAVVGTLRTLGQDMVKPMYEMVRDAFP